MKKKHVADFKTFINENNNFVDYESRWVYGKDGIENLILSYKTTKPPHKNLVISHMNEILNRYKENTEYSNFTPKVLIIYPFQYGYTSGYNAYFTINEDGDGQLSDPETGSRRGFFDEVNGKTFEYRL